MNLREEVGASASRISDGVSSYELDTVPIRICTRGTNLRDRDILQRQPGRPTERSHHGQVQVLRSGA
jgi:hypothetical protein